MFCEFYREAETDPFINMSLQIIPRERDLVKIKDDLYMVASVTFNLDTLAIRIIINHIH